MNNKSLSVKVGVLVLAITLALATTVAVIGAPSATAEGGAVAPEIEGTWLVTITIQDGPPPFQSLVTYARGGALTVTDSSVSPALGNLYQGTWTKTGPHEFAFTFLGFQYDTNGVFTNYIRARETIQFQPGGKAYDGVTIIEILDTDMNLIATASSIGHATRVNAQ